MEDFVKRQRERDVKEKVLVHNIRQKKRDGGCWVGPLTHDIRHRGGGF